jgi:hypothetical protein
MFGKKMDFEFPKISPETVETIRKLMVEANTVLASKPGSDKKAWVKIQAKDAVKNMDLKKIPAFLEDPIKEAVIGVVVDVTWALVFDPNRTK